jgi:hypothetical protein
VDNNEATIHAEIRAIREVLEKNPDAIINGESIEDKQKRLMHIRELAAHAADNAPLNADLMQRGREIFATMPPSQRKWGNTYETTYETTLNKSNKNQQEQEKQERQKEEQEQKGGRKSSQALARTRKLKTIHVARLKRLTRKTRN